jgi:hypothetical protein
MKRIFAVATVIAAFSAGVAVAGETTQAGVSIEKQLRDLKKMAGAGEISTKEYNKRKDALMAAAEGQQTADSSKK